MAAMWGTGGELSPLPAAGGPLLLFFLFVVSGGDWAVARDCTGVECPPLENCIKEALEPGACCAHCVRLGCRCQGYQYYDCLRHGFRGGRVPAGRGYLVDSGSTECLCPPGGGHIACHFLPCPELPQNCIAEVLPLLGRCPECAQMGCHSNGQTYSEGDSFYVEPCTICHCLNSGTLMCTPSASCQSVHVVPPSTAAHDGKPRTVMSQTRRPQRNMHIHPVHSAPTPEPQQTMPDVDPTLPDCGQASYEAPCHHPQRVPFQTMLEPHQLTPDSHHGSAELTPLPSVQDPQKTATAGRHALLGVPLAAPKLQTVHVAPDLEQATPGMQHTLPGLYRAVPKHASPTQGSYPQAFQAPSPPPQGLQEQHPAPKDSQDPNPAPINSQDHYSSLLNSQDQYIPPLNSLGPGPARQDSKKHHFPPLNSLNYNAQPQGPQVHQSPPHGPSLLSSEDSHRFVLWPWDSHVPPQYSSLLPQDSGNSAGSLRLTPRWPPATQEAERFRSRLEECCAAGRQWREQGKQCLDMTPCPRDAGPCWSVRVQCCHSLQEEGECHAGVAIAEAGGSCLQEGGVECGPSVQQRCCECCSLGLMARTLGLPCDETPHLGMTCGPVFSNCCQAIPSSSNRQEPRKPQRMPAGNLDEFSAQPCSSGPRCIKSRESSTCLRQTIRCGGGYHASEDGTRCEDIDECQLGSHRCQEGQICHNTVGSYRCDCPQGYKLHPLLAKCVDVNECESAPCHQQCTNVDGSYRCLCRPGYVLSSLDQDTCEDVNECESAPCHQECTNVDGSYRCLCRPGYVLSSLDQVTCEDVDECAASGGSMCSYHCVNSLGSFQCTCPSHGYTLTPNGRNCRDLDECALGTHNCSTSESCFNIHGGFRCLSFPCPQNYQRADDTRCERLTCGDFRECQTEPQRISYYRLTFPSNIHVPANIFRISPSPVVAGDAAILTIPRGNEEGYFSTRRVNSHTGYVFLQFSPQEPKDFLLDVEMSLIRQGMSTKFLAKLYVFITGPNL
ncbi:fibulin-2-like isoform X2 [Ambystoma mexicanum]|uniref:fibulin-2-like isoform X2 n=1 Tax=Ambystoma mexicanum TaxID=8296 RepID=UPI0037E87705